MEERPQGTLISGEQCEIDGIAPSIPPCFLARPFGGQRRLISAGNGALWATGNEGRTTGGFHAVQRNGDSIHRVRAAAFGNGENTFA